MTDPLGTGIFMNPWVTLPLVVLAAIVFTYLLRALALWIVSRAVQRVSQELDSPLYQLLRGYLFPLIIIGGLLIFLDAIPLPPRILHAAERLLGLSGLLLSIFLLTKTALLILRHVASRYETVGSIRGPVEIFIKIVIITAGGMMVLDHLGISLTPILTTLGLGSLVVAIALQDTLANFFAGLYIKADRPFEIGHYVRLEAGPEGFVDRIGWRSTQLRTLQNNAVVVPNSKLAQTIITNFDLPEEPVALAIPISVSYDSDPQKVEEVLADEVRQAVGEVEGLAADPKPSVRLIPGFGDFALNFTLTCRVRRFVDQFHVQHELRKKVLKRLEKEKIQIAFRRIP